MRRELIVKSRSLAGTSDLTLLAKIKPGLVPSLDTVTHKTRIKRLLQTLGAGRSSSQEYALLRPFSDAVERVGKIHSVRVAVLEPEDKVMLAVTFDGSWEAYIRVLWQKVGTLLDIIFFDTEDYVSAYDNRFEEWEKWCRRVQVETHFFYGTPYLTVDDVRSLRHQEIAVRRSPGTVQADLAATRYAVQTAEHLSWQAAAKTSGQNSLETLKQGLESLSALYRLADLYLPSTEDGLFLQRASRDLLFEFRVMLETDEFPAELLARARRRFDKQLVWLQKEVPAPTNLRRMSPPMPTARPEFDAADVQGGILRAYANASHGCLLLLAIADRGKAVAFFRKLVAEVTRENAPPLAPGDVAANVAFTYEGLRAIGLAEDELAIFPEEFRQGMEARASALGDVRTNHPRRWSLPARFGRGPNQAAAVELSSVHMVLHLRAMGASPETGSWSDAAYLARPEFAPWFSAIQGNGLTLLSVQQLRRNFAPTGETTEHFGFADGGSDPGIDPPPPGRRYANQIHLGELLIGYENEADWPPDPALAVDVVAERRRQSWLRNGSFLVVRKLAQDVAALEEALDKSVPAADKARVLAKMMGRDRAGKALANVDQRIDRINDFDYSDDAEGRRCPLHAHIRRANPRVAVPGVNEPLVRRTPRIVRRGMSYGPAMPAVPTEQDRLAERGLVFMAYNADIGEQFEVIQRWISGGNSSGGYSGQSDPFLGVADNGSQRFFRFEDDNEQVVSVGLDGSDEALGQRRPFVRLEWGSYLFAPSLSALRGLRDVLASGRTTLEPAWSAMEGEVAICKLLAADACADAWKAALEDPVEIEKFRAASIWAAIREHHGGVLKTRYGVLVAEKKIAMQVLHDEAGNYSVSGYRARLADSIGEIYLGQDDGAEYQRLCQPVNEAIGSITRLQAFDEARAATRVILQDTFLAKARTGGAINPVRPERWELTLDLKEVIDPVLGLLCQGWFGLPADPQASADIRMAGSRWDADPHQALYPGHFTAPSRYVFQPRPGESAKAFGCEYGRILTSGFSRFLEASIANCSWPPSGQGNPPIVANAIWKAFGGSGDTGLVARTLVGAMMGFLPTVDGNLRRSLGEWLYEGTFWSLRTAWQALKVAGRNLAAAERLLGPPLLQAMQLRPSPELVWRTATHDHTLGPVEVLKDDIVVVSIVSASQACLASGDPDDYLLFGGNRKEAFHPTHACPGYEAAMGVLLGFIAELLNVEDSMRPSVVPLALTFEGPLQAPIPPTKEEKKEAAANEAAAAARSAASLQRLLPLPGPVSHGAGKAPPRAAKPLRPKPPLSPRPLVIGIGDSWFHYFAIDIFDVLCEEYRFDAVSLSVEGVGLRAMQNDPAQLVRLGHLLSDRLRENVRPAAIMLSAGGNDVVTPRLTKLLAEFGTVPALVEKEVVDLIEKEMGSALVDIVEKIMLLCEAQLGARIPIILHGYDYPRPDGRGALGPEAPAWLHPDFASRHYPDDDSGVDAAAAVMKDLIDRLNDMQKVVAAAYSDIVTHVDLRGTLRAGDDYRIDWGNELHPTPEGFKAVARKMAKAVRKAIKVA